MANKVDKRAVKFTVKIGKKSHTFPSIEAAAKHFKIPYGVLYQRLFTMEWDKAKAVTTKVRKLKRKKKVAKKRR